MHSLFVCFILLLLTSCIQPHAAQNRLQQLDKYLAADEFDQALTFIEKTPHTDKNVAGLKKEHEIVIKQLQIFEKKTIATALKQEKKNDWQGAKHTYDAALVNAAASKALAKANQDMLLRFHGKIDSLEREELITNGTWLNKRLPLLENLHAYAPEDDDIRLRYMGAKSEAEATGLALLQLGERMLKEKNTEMARRTLPLAAQLLPGKESDEANAQLNKLLQAKKKKRKQSRKKIAQAKKKKNIEAFNNAIAFGMFSKAQKQLDQLTAAGDKSIEVELMRERLKKAKEEYIREETAIGTAFYRVGEYELALQVWQNVIALDPNNEDVKVKMNRAQKIVNKLRALRKRKD